MQNIQGGFYPITTEEVIKTLSNLTTHEICILLYLRTMNYEGKTLVAPSAKIASELGITKRTVNSSLEVLRDRKLLPSWFVYKNPSNRDNTEHRIRDRIREELGAVEALTPVGRINLITDTEIVEVREISRWKTALGKLLTYSSYFPEHTKRVHLFGACNLTKLGTITAICEEFDITVTFEEVQAP